MIKFSLQGKEHVIGFSEVFFTAAPSAAVILTLVFLATYLIFGYSIRPVNLVAIILSVLVSLFKRKLLVSGEGNKVISWIKAVCAGTVLLFIAWNVGFGLGEFFGLAFGS